MVTVKPYSEKYKEDVKLICMNTGPGSVFTDEKMREYILSTYCYYYIEKEPENVFLIVDENDVAQGYIFGAADFDGYIRAFRPYLKRVKKTGIGNLLTAIAEISGHLIFKKKYPAHLHINLNEGFRRNGNGSLLMKTQLENMKSKGIKGIMLITGSGNTPAVNFYKKNGFRPLTSIKIGGAEIMAKEL